MERPRPALWQAWVMIGTLIIVASGGWSGAPWRAGIDHEAARSSIKFLIGLATVLIGALLRYRASRLARLSRELVPPAA
jgi:hypothetical protein